MGILLGDLILDKRREKRITPAYQPKGELYLYTGEQRLNIQTARDVSPFGIGLQIDGPLTNGAEVRLTYQHGEVNLQVYGSVIWNMAVEENAGVGECPRSYRVGLSLYPEDKGVNLQFFRTLTGRQ